MSIRDKLLDREAVYLGMVPGALLDDRMARRAENQKGDIARIKQKFADIAFRDGQVILDMNLALPQGIQDSFYIREVERHSYEGNSRQYFGQDYPRQLREEGKTMSPERGIAVFHPKPQAFRQQLPDQENAFLSSQEHILNLAQYILLNTGEGFEMRSYLMRDEVIAKNTGVTVFSNHTPQPGRTRKGLRMGILTGFDHIDDAVALMKVYTTLANGYDFLHTQGTAARGHEHLQKEFASLRSQG